MRRAFPFAEVQGYSGLEPLLTNDPKDRHVLAGAIKAQVHTIVTVNIKDFPRSSLEPWDIEVVHPDVFLLNQLDLAPGHVLTAFDTMQAAFTVPRRSSDEILRALARSGAPDFADELRRHLPSR